MAKKIYLTQKDHDFIGRELKRGRGAGKGEIPLPRRRRLGEGGSRGAAGASGTFVCTLNSDFPATIAGDEVEMQGGTGVVYEILPAGELSLLGSRQIYNPFRILLPAAGGGETIQYTCAKTTEVEGSDDDEFTITGIDPLHLLASLTGFAANKLLYTDGTLVTDIQWGGTCPAVVTSVACVDGDVTGVTANYILIVCTP